MEWRPSGTSCPERDIVCRTACAPSDRCTGGRSFFFTCHAEPSDTHTGCLLEKWTQHTQKAWRWFSHSSRRFPQAFERSENEMWQIAQDDFDCFLISLGLSGAPSRPPLWPSRVKIKREKETQIKVNPDQKFSFRKSLSINQQNNNKKTWTGITIVTVKVCGSRSEQTTKGKEC